MAKNAQNSWVGNQYQPTFPTYQTAGMLQPRTPTTPVTPPPQTPVTPPTGGTGGTGSGGGTPTVGGVDPGIGSGSVLNLAPEMPVVQPPPIIQPQPITTNEPQRDRLINAILGAQVMEQ